MRAQAKRAVAIPIGGGFGVVEQGVGRAERILLVVRSRAAVVGAQEIPILFGGRRVFALRGIGAVGLLQDVLEVVDELLGLGGVDFLDAPAFGVVGQRDCIAHWMHCRQPVVLVPGVYRQRGRRVLLRPVAAGVMRVG